MSGEQQQLRIAITGGTSGLGRALVHELGGRGALVAFPDENFSKTSVVSL